MIYIPSYKEYKVILNDIKKSGKLMDYKDAASATEFIVLRHDVEFSLDRALSMAQIEFEESVASTYFIQITNNAYNALSVQNRAKIRLIYEMGHKIGLHYHLNGVIDPVKTRDGIRDQIRIMSEMCCIPIDRFSIHRPVREVYYNLISIDGIVNAYSPDFFTLIENANLINESALNVKYIADSRHRWNYGYPDLNTFYKYKKIQLLIHPDFWSKLGYEAKENFNLLIHENIESYIETIDTECKHFGPYKEELKNTYCLRK